MSAGRRSENGGSDPPPVEGGERGASGDAELSFEGALERLEAVVDSLEDGELELEAALKRFEEGVRLTRHCGEQLREAERRIDILVSDGEKLVLRPFEAVADDSEIADGEFSGESS